MGCLYRRLYQYSALLKHQVSKGFDDGFRTGCGENIVHDIMVLAVKSRQYGTEGFKGDFYWVDIIPRGLSLSDS